MPGAIEAVAHFELAGFLVFALTKIPSSNPYAATENTGDWAKTRLAILHPELA
jgi:hypothetical protein